MRSRARSVLLGLRGRASQRARVSTSVEKQRGTAEAPHDQPATGAAVVRYSCMSMFDAALAAAPATRDERTLACPVASRHSSLV
eukprot:5163166-Prymnesium_polylepis.2